MDLDIILTQKPYNEHYLKRYLMFIANCANQQLDKFETHHICPKANDLFPEYRSFKDHPWNICKLTPRQHYVAHWILWKVFGGSQTRAFWKFNHGQGQRINSKTYELLKIDFSKNQSLLMKRKPKSLLHAEKLRNRLIKYNASPEQSFRSKQRMTGRNVSKEERDKISKGVSDHVKNTIWINDGIINKRILKTESIPEGFVRGRLMSKDQVNKMTASRKPVSQETKDKMSKSHSIRRNKLLSTSAW